jgi:hypothetical protein
MVSTLNAGGRGDKFRLAAMGRRRVISLDNLLNNSSREGAGTTESLISSKIMQAACPHAAFLGYFNYRAASES